MSLTHLTAESRNNLAERLTNLAGNAFAMAYAARNAADAIRLGAERDEEALAELFRIAGEFPDFAALEAEFDLAEMMGGKRHTF